MEKMKTIEIDLVNKWICYFCDAKQESFDQEFYLIVRMDQHENIALCPDCLNNQRFTK